MAGIYIHVPFCHAKCAYCDFYSVAGSRKIDDYVNAVAIEYEARKEELRDEGIDTLYFGGGTPSCLPAASFSKLASFFKADRETTIEVNPEDVTPENVSVWLEAGVNRVSMGVQSLVDSELGAVRRRHTAAEALSAISILRKSGIDNISCDLIYGLPGQTLESWEFSVSRLLDCGIDHLSAYALTFEDGTLITKWRDTGKISEIPEELTEQMYDSLCHIASRFGFMHYEISNFCLPDRRSLHNSSYWRGTPYLGLGPGAHSLDVSGIRRYNPPSLKRYLENPAGSPVIDEENETDRINDIIMVSLRTAEGLDIEKMPSETREYILRNASAHIKSGNLVNTGSRLVIPEERWLLADSVVRDLFL